MTILRRWLDPQGRWWFQIFFLFTPNLGEMIQFDEPAYLSNGLAKKNHQLDKSPRQISQITMLESRNPSVWST